jgi:hypothetical protein
VKLSHSPTARFDDPNLVGYAGLAPVLSLAERAGLSALVGQRLRVPGEAGACPVAKVTSLVAGMLAGVDTIDGMDLVRHGAMTRLFTGVRAPSTLGLFLRAFTPGAVRQLQAVSRSLLDGLATGTPVLAGTGQVAYIDVDDTIRGTYGYQKQGTARGYSGVKGLNAIVATVSSPTCAPMIAASRLRAGNSASAAGIASVLGPVLAEAIRRQRAAGPGRHLVLVRADSAYYGQALTRTVRRYGACFSVTARMDRGVSAAIASIPESAWTPIRYRRAVWNQADQQWDSEAQVAEVAYTAFTNRRLEHGVPGRLIVRRVKRLGAAHVGPGQGELFTTWRYHPVFTNSTLPMLDAEATHRDHAIIEQVIAELKDGPLAHAPSGRFQANAAWLTLATIAFNLTRAAGTLASPFHAKARGATIRAQLIAVPARIASRARRIVLHLPTGWPWRSAWETLQQATGPPAATPS